MAKLNQLIKDLCPAGVPYLKISDIADTFIGLATSVTKYKSESGVQLLHNSDISEGKIIVKTVEYITEAFAQKNSKKLLRKNDVITVHTGNVGTSAVITEEYDGCIGFTTISSRVKNQNQISPEYLCAFLNSNASKEQIAGKSISDRNNLNLAAFDEIVIPVPPLPVQNEIVRILNNFAELTAELTTKLAAELTARKKQHNHYWDDLLTFESDVPMVSLSSVAIYSKDRIAANIMNEDNYIGVENLLQNRAGKRKASTFPKDGNVVGFTCDDILIGNIRPYLKKIWYADCNGGTNGDVLVIRSVDPAVLHPRYLYWVLASDAFFDYDSSNAKGAKMPRGDKSAVMEYKFPLPSLNRQVEIVSVFELLDAMCREIIETLPAEIEARQKQYEYYRDKLLMFTNSQ